MAEGHVYGDILPQKIFEKCHFLHSERSTSSQRQTWSRQCIMRRETLGAHSNLIRELNAGNPQQQENHSMKFWQ